MERTITLTNGGELRIEPVRNTGARLVWFDSKGELFDVIETGKDISRNAAVQRLLLAYTRNSLLQTIPSIELDRLVLGLN